MAGTGVIFLVGFILFLAVLIYFALQSNNPREAYVSRLKLYHNIKTGYKCKIDTDYNNPEDYLKADRNNPEQMYIMRESKGMMDRGDRRVNLSKNYTLLKYEGYTQILDEINLLGEEALTKINRLEAEKKELTNWVASLVPTVKSLRSNEQKNVNEIIEVLKKMNDSMPKMFIKGGKNNAGQKQ